MTREETLIESGFSFRGAETGLIVGCWSSLSKRLLAFKPPNLTDKVATAIVADDDVASIAIVHLINECIQLVLVMR